MRKQAKRASECRTERARRMNGARGHTGPLRGEGAVNTNHPRNGLKKRDRANRLKGGQWWMRWRGGVACCGPITCWKVAIATDKSEGGERFGTECVLHEWAKRELK